MSDPETKEPPPPPDAIPENPDLENIRARIQGAVADVFKRTVSAGLAQAQGTKDELFRMLADELRAWLEKVNLPQEVAKLLSQVTLEIKTEVRFHPAEDGTAKPEIRPKISIKRSEKRDQRPEESGEDAGGGGEGDR